MAETAIKSLFHSFQVSDLDQANYGTGFFSLINFTVYTVCIVLNSPNFHVCLL